MKKVNFIEINKGSYFEYHLPCGDGLLDDSLFYKKFELNKTNAEAWYQYLWDSAITNIATHENSLLYAIIVKTLSNKPLIDMVTFKDTISLKKHLNPIKLKKIEWAYSIEFTSDDSFLCRQYGYQTPFEFLNEMNYFNKNLAHRKFTISRIKQEHLNSYIKTYDCDVTNWKFFLNSNWNGLVEILQDSEKRPETSDILEFSDCIVNLQIGGDEGYLDYVLIQSKIQLTEKIEMLKESITKYGKSLEKIISDINPIDEEWKINTFKEHFNKINKQLISS